MGSIKKMIDYAKSRWHVPKYVMGGGRIGNQASYNSSTDDCSSYVYKCLKKGGFIPESMWNGSTEDLYRLARQGKYLKEISYSQVKAGDIFVKGKEGASAGAYGHTGIFLRKGEIIHCNAGQNWTVTTNDESEGYWHYLDDSYYPVRFFRPIGNTDSGKTNKKVYLDKVIDMSEWQDPKNIDYDKLAKDIDACILRVSVSLKNGKKIRLDKNFRKHYEELRKRNIPLGYYHYSNATNKDEALKEAKFILDELKDKAISLPIYIDVEDPNYQVKSNKESISNVVITFCEKVEKEGLWAGYYSYPWFIRNFINNKVRKDYTCWMADYSSPGMQSRINDIAYHMWQYTCKGRVKGYGGDIDISKTYADFLNLIKPRKVKKSIEQLVDEVIEGFWSVGSKRKDLLTKAGYDYQKIQDAVNKKLDDKKEFYIVKKDDTLESIAKKYKTTKDKILKLNRDLFVGQEIRVK